jgi:hypothetical protein
VPWPFPIVFSFKNEGSQQRNVWNASHRPAVVIAVETQLEGVAHLWQLFHISGLSPVFFVQESVRDHSVPSFCRWAVPNGPTNKLPTEIEHGSRETEVCAFGNNQCRCVEPAL